jgi:hypothetical protein
MRGRKLQIGETSVRLYARHTKTCSEKADNSGTVWCKCIRWIQFKDGERVSTRQWTWPKAENEARQIFAARTGIMNAALKPGTYSVERALDEWIAERDQDKLHNTKARHMGKILLAWCHRNGIEYLTQIEKQALRTWRSTGVSPGCRLD